MSEKNNNQRKNIIVAVICVFLIVAAAVCVILNKIKGLLGVIDLLKSKINQKMQTIQQKQLKLEQKLSVLENGTNSAANTDLAANDNDNDNDNAAVLTAKIESERSENPPEPVEPMNSEVESHSADKLDGAARKGKMSSLLEKYSDWMESKK